MSHKLYNALFITFELVLAFLLGWTAHELWLQHHPEQVPKVTVQVWHVLGDVNDDNVVNDKDIDITRNNQGKQDAEWSDGDVNQDGTVDAIDLSIVLKNHGKRGGMMGKLI